jgi:hypothetical protein
MESKKHAMPTPITVRAVAKMYGAKAVGKGYKSDAQRKAVHAAKAEAAGKMNVADKVAKSMAYDMYSPTKNIESAGGRYIGPKSAAYKYGKKK